MNNRTFLIPGFINWTFKTSDTGCGLYPPATVIDPGLVVTADTPVLEIFSYAQITLWLKFHMSGVEAEKASKAIYSFDWPAMIREAGTDVQHQSPSLPDWTLKISDSGSGLWHSSGASVPVTADTPVQEIADGVRRVLLQSLVPVEVDVQVDEVMRIDFAKLILNAWSPRAAPLLEGFTADNSAFVEAICADVRQLAVLKKDDSTATADEVCALLKTLA